VLVLIGQIEHHESLSRDGEPMKPHEGVDYPTCVGFWMRLPFWSGNVAACSFKPVRRRDSRAA
jgi:hypothetical protein